MILIWPVIKDLTQLSNPAFGQVTKQDSKAS